MALVVIFMMGIANFALHSAVIDSGHDMVRAMMREGSLFSPRITLGIEFAMLLVAFLLVASGYEGWAWAYSFYTAANAAFAWAILTGRI